MSSHSRASSISTRLAVHMFSEVGDLRPVAFLDFMTHDKDAAVAALARDVGERLSSPV